MLENPTTLETAWLVAARLERLSADSIWSHRASGLRGGLMRCLSDIEAEEQAGAISPENIARLEMIVAQGFRILALAAREINPPQI